LQTFSFIFFAFSRVLASKDAEIERLGELRISGGGHEDQQQDYRQALESLQAEQDDLLLMLSDQGPIL
jgi:hypothetical protein